MVIIGIYFNKDYSRYIVSFNSCKIIRVVQKNIYPEILTEK